LVSGFFRFVEKLLGEPAKRGLEASRASVPWFSNCPLAARVTETGRRKGEEWRLILDSERAQLGSKKIAVGQGQAFTDRPVKIVFADGSSADWRCYPRE
jgi:hypothetical protein